jgi:hypothetical protein
MSEVEKDVQDRKAEEEATSGKNGKASKLIDAAIWIFVVTSLSIVTSSSIFPGCRAVCITSFGSILAPGIIWK